jgi:hypothetical protein
MIVKYVTLDGYKKLLLEQEAKILPVPRVGDLVNIKYETDNGSFTGWTVKQVEWFLDIDNRCTVEVLI